MTYKVITTVQSENDLLDIYMYVAKADSPVQADRLIDGLEETLASLESTPTRGQAPAELDRLGVFRYLQVHFGPYRIIYEIEADTVIIVAVLDGRRNMQALLDRRLLRPWD